MAGHRLTTSERQQIIEAMNLAKATEFSLLNGTDLNWRDRVEERKKKVAVGMLKIDKEMVEMAKLEDQIHDVQQKLELVEQRITAKLPLQKRGADRYGSSSCPTKKTLCQAIADIRSEVGRSVMAKDPTGKKYLTIVEKYRRKQEAFLACSTREDVANAGIFEPSPS